MKISRRSAINRLLVLSAGMALLPACARRKDKTSLELANIRISGEQEEWLAELAETILSKTGTPGAKDLSAHLFALMMVDDCHTKEEQQAFASGMKRFDEMTRERHGKSFAGCSAGQKRAWLTDLENKKEIPEEVLSFYGSMKQLTVQCYTTSEYFLTHIQPYVLVPGRFYGCVPVSEA